jgi:hypothetical protein
LSPPDTTFRLGDIGAFECRKAIVNHVFKEGRVRRSFEALKTEGRVWKIAIFSADNLKTMLESKKDALAELAKKRTIKEQMNGV